MEYPMMVNDISKDDPHYTIKLTSHEIFDSYFPFYMGINEPKYACMDEGWATFGDYLILCALDSPERASFYFLEGYREHIGYMLDIPIFGDSEFIKKPTYRYNAYTKPAAFLLILKDLLGDDLFKKALHAYIDRWHGKHPMPYDFFYTFSDAIGQNLNWLIKPWFFEYGYVDLAIKDVSLQNDKYNIVIEKKGHYPAPIKLKVTYADDTNEIISEKASVWKNGDVFYTIEKPASKRIKSVELYEHRVLDADSSNDKFKPEILK